MERLYIHNAFEKDKFGRNFHEVLEKMPEVQHNDGLLEVDLDSGARNGASAHSTDNDSSFVPTSIQDRLWFPHISLQDNEALGDGDYLSPEMQFGIQFHLLISRLNHESDIHSTVDAGIRAGDISMEFKDSLMEKLNEVFQQQAYKALFEQAISVLSEQEFIVNKEKSVRLDRVILKADSTIIIDYKTGLPKAKDEKQVQEYAFVLSEMNYPNVEGYLFYVGENTLKRVI
jgi:hypothetical protein